MELQTNHVIVAAIGALWQEWGGTEGGVLQRALVDLAGISSACRRGAPSLHGRGQYVHAEGCYCN